MPDTLHWRREVGKCGVSTIAGPILTSKCIQLQDVTISVLQTLCVMAHPFLGLLPGMQGSEETHSENTKQF